MQDEHTTDVVFRVWNDEPFKGDVGAYFPEIREDDGCIACYVHVGQHGSADYQHVLRHSRPARPEEYAELKRELEVIGYRLHVLKRRRRFRRS